MRKNRVENQIRPIRKIELYPISLKGAIDRFHNVIEPCIMGPVCLSNLENKDALQATRNMVQSEYELRGDK